MPLPSKFDFHTFKVIKLPTKSKKFYEPNQLDILINQWYYKYLPLIDPVVLYCVTSVTSFDSRATFILYLLSYERGRPSLEDVLSLVPFSFRRKVNTKLSAGKQTNKHLLHITKLHLTMRHNNLKKLLYSGFSEQCRTVIGT